MKQFLVNVEILLIFLSFVLAGCSSDSKEEYKPSIPTIEFVDDSGTNPLVGTEGGTTTLTFTASDSWTASVEAATRSVDWVSVSPTSGKAGRVTLQITTQSNDSYDERNAAIRLRCGSTEKTVTVTQKQKNALIVNSNKVELDVTGGTFALTLQTNIDVDYEIEPAAGGWLTAVSNTRGLQTSTLNFHAAENLDLEPRQAVITLRGGELTEQVTVYQTGDKPVILLSQKEYMVSSGGETIKVDLKSNTSYELRLPDVSWIREATTRSLSAYTHYFTILPNDTYDMRTTEIVFFDKEKRIEEKVMITQKQKDALIVNSNKVELDVTGGTFALTLQANIDVDYEIEPAAGGWLTAVSNTRGLQTSTLNFHAAENLDLEPRQAVITLRGGELTEQVTVYQMGAKPVILLSQKEYMVSSGGETIKVELKSNTSYELRLPDVSWIREATTRSLSAYTHYFTILPNDTYDMRTTEIVFFDKEKRIEEKVTITQMQKNAIVVAQDEYTVEATGGRLDFSVKANVDFTVETSVDWIQQIDTRGLTETSLHFQIAENTTEGLREAIIRLKSSDLNQMIKVSQKGNSQTDGSIDEIPLQPW